MKITLNVKDEKLDEFLKFLNDISFVSIENISQQEDDSPKEPLKLDKLSKKIEDYFNNATIKVEKVWLFGSYARQEADVDSDVDLIVEFLVDSKVDLWDFVGIKHDLEDILNVSVDLVRAGGARPTVFNDVEKEKILIYERKTSKGRKTETYLGSC